MPKWDEGEAIYAGILQELDDAEAKLDGTARISSDIMLGKNLNQWIGFANAVRLKLLMRASFAQDNSAKIKALIEKDNFFSGDVMFDNFTDDPNKRNPWYTTNKVSLANNHVGAMPIIAYMNAASIRVYQSCSKRQPLPANITARFPDRNQRWRKTV